MKKSSVLGLRVFTSLFLVLFVFAQPLLAIESLEVRDEVPMIEEDISEDILEEGISDPEEIAKPTPVWNVSGNTAVTTKDVVLGEVYIAPQNSGVTVTFTRLPDVSSTLSVTKILLTDEEVVATGAVSNVAYDISTGMVDGTFEYDLTLPNTGDDSKVVYAENRSGLLGDVNEVSNVVENGDILKVSGLDHFTVFVVVDDGDTDFTALGWSNHASGYDDDHKWVTSSFTGSNATWTYTGASIMGGAAIFVSWTQWSDHATNAMYTSPLFSGFTVNQKLNSGQSTTDGNGVWSGWYRVPGSFTNIPNGTEVTLGVDSGVTDGNLSADAIAFVDLNEAPMTVWVDDDYSYNNSGYHFWGYDAFNNLQNALSAVSDGGTIYIANGTYVESGQIVFNKKITIIGESKENVTIKPNGNTGNSGDTRGWFLINTGKSLSFSGITLDGNGKLVNIGVLSHGDLYISDSIITNIQYNASGPDYAGRGIAVYDANAIIQSSTISNFGRIGIYIYGATAKMLASGNTIIGKGEGDHLDYTAEAEGGAELTLSNNDLSQCKGVASVDGSISAAVLATTYFAGGTNIIVSNNNIHDNYLGLALGYGNSDTTSAILDLNIFANNDYDIDNGTKNDIDARNTRSWSVTDQNDLDEIEASIFHNCNESPYTHGACNAEDYATGFGFVQYKDLLAPTNLRFTTTGGTLLGCGAYTNQYDIVAAWDAPFVNGIASYEYRSYNPTTGWIYGPVSVGNSLSRKGAFTVGDGVYGFAVRAIDLAGNKSSWTSSDLAGSCKITYDGTTPSLLTGLSFSDKDSTEVKMCGAKTSSHVGAIIHWDASTDVNFDHYEYRSFNADGSTGPLRIFTTNSFDASWWTVPMEGTYGFQVRAVDKAGNVGEWTNTCDINVDWTAPDVTTTGIQYPNATIVNSFVTSYNTPTIIGEIISADTASVQLTVNSQTYDATISGTNWSANITHVLPDGTYTMQIVATDDVGNSKTTTQDITIDTKAPTATYTHYNNGVEVLGAQAFVQNVNQLTFTGSYTDFDPSSGLYWDSFVIFDAQADGSFNFSQNGAKAYCSWRKTPNLLALSGTTYDIDTPVAFTDCVSTLPEGTYYMAHHVYDSATRKDIPTINQFRDVLGLKFTVDTTAPKSQFTGADLSGTYHNSPIVFSGESYDVNGVVSVTLLSRPVGSSGDWTIIETIENPSASNTFEWISNPWTPEDNGRYDIKAEATDQAGNTEHSPMMSNITYDTTAPKVKNVDINIDYFGTYVNGKTGFLISVPVSDSLSGIDRNTCEYTIDGAWLPATYAMGNCGMWIDNDRLMDGDNLSISLRVTDKAGNTSTSRVLNREVDKADATSSVNPLNPYYGPLSLPVISGIANDTVSNVTDVKIRMTRSSDGKNWIGRSMWSYLPGLQDVDGTYTWTLNKTLPSMQNGVTYTVTPYAADQVHGFSEGTSESFVWDSQPPQDPTWIRSTSHTSAPSQDRTIDIRFGGATDDLSGVKGYYYSFSQTPETPSQDSRNWLPAWAWRVTSNRLADGVWYFNIRTVDNVGNITSTAHSSAFIVDTTAPQTPVISSPTDEAYFNTQPILNDWNDVYDVNGIHYYRVEYRYDDGHPIPNGKYRITTISERNHIPQEWEQGGAKFRVQAIDNAGNVGPWSEWRHYFYDSVAPDVEITSPTEEYLTGTVEIRGTVTDANPHHYWFVIQNSIGKKVAGPGTVSETDSFTDELLLNWDTTKVPDGDYTIKLEARDSADNKDSGSVHWMIVHVDNQAPIVDISTPSGLIAGTVDVIGSLTDLNPSTYTLEIKNTLTGDKVMLDVDQPTGEFTDQTLYTWDTTLGDDGEYDITFTGEDLAGNSTTIGVTGIIVDNTKPTATVLGTLTFITGDTTPRGINLADNNELDQVCYIIDTNTQQCVNIGGTGFFWDVSSLINTLGVGSHTFTYYVVDKAGNQSDSGVIEGENTNYLANITVNDVPAVAGAATTTLFAQAPVETEEETTTEEENTTEDTQTSEEVKGVEDTDSNDEEEAKNTLPWWAYVLGGGVIISFFLFLIWRRRKDKEEKNY